MNAALSCECRTLTVAWFAVSFSGGVATADRGVLLVEGGRYVLRWVAVGCGGFPRQHEEDAVDLQWNVGLWCGGPVGGPPPPDGSRAWPVVCVGSLFLFPRRVACKQSLGVVAAAGAFGVTWHDVWTGMAFRSRAVISPWFSFELPRVQR